MEIEDRFEVTLPFEGRHPVCNAVFTRQPFRLADLAELVYLQQGTGAPERTRWRHRRKPTRTPNSVPFTQLDGRWRPGSNERHRLFERLPADDGPVQFRRRSDGMRCVAIPSAEVKIGSDSAGAFDDEQPRHVVGLDAFLIDAEPVRPRPGRARQEADSAPNGCRTSSEQRSQ